MKDASWSKVRPINSSHPKAGSQTLPRSRPRAPRRSRATTNPFTAKDAKGAKENPNHNHSAAEPQPKTQHVPRRRGEQQKSKSTPQPQRTRRSTEKSA